MALILVTGGAGFVGSHLCEALAERDDNQIWSLDNYSTGKRQNHVDGVNYIEGQTSDIETLLKISPDIVYHLGEYSRVEQSFGDLDRLWKSNMDGTFSVLKFCKDRNSKLVYAGSSTKFGDNGLGRHQSPYSWSKASNVDLIKNFGEWYGLKYAITHISTMYMASEKSQLANTQH